jgi:hypothetical protein
MKSKQTKVGEVTHGAHSLTIRQRYSDLRTTEGKQLADIMTGLVEGLGGQGQAVADDIRQTLKNQKDANIFDILLQRNLIHSPGEEDPFHEEEKSTRDPDLMSQAEYEHWRSKGKGKQIPTAVGGTLPSGRKIKW